LDDLNTLPNDDLIIEYQVVDPAQFSAPKDRGGHYLLAVAVYLGIDFKLFSDADTRTIVVSPPCEADVPVDPYPHPYRKRIQAFPASAETVPPRTELEYLVPHETRFTGTWRSKISLEWRHFGPIWGRSQRMPERALVADLEAACETRLLEHSEQY
jgi:hypothetical protein